MPFHLKNTLLLCHIIFGGCMGWISIFWFFPILLVYKKSCMILALWLQVYICIIFFKKYLKPYSNEENSFKTCSFAECQNQWGEQCPFLHLAENERKKAYTHTMNRFLWQHLLSIELFTFHNTRVSCSCQIFCVGVLKSILNQCYIYYIGYFQIIIFSLI